jgi:hypothetical protein
MRLISYSGVALLAVVMLGGGASAANICHAGNLTCATTMPVDGYCECTAHGVTKDGTVIPKPAPHAPVNSTAAGCGAHPGTPGCP